MRSRVVARIEVTGPGLLIAGLVALAASWLSEHYGAPVMLFALLLGIAVNFISQEPRCQAGIEFASRSVLRLGVALLGLRITFHQIQSLGVKSLALTATAVLLTILSGWLLARTLRLQASFGVLTGGAVAICGASAALAIASVLPRTPTRERDTVVTVVSVTALSTIAMIIYPVLTTALGFNAHTAGVFLGATIHDVAQVVGAGYSISNDAGDAATIVKLFRVALLLPAVIVIGFLFRTGHEAGAGHVRPPILPMFLVAFAVLVTLNSTGWLPLSVNTGLQATSRWCLVIAIAALGTKTSLGDLVRVGWRPIAVIVAESVVVAVVVMVGLFVLSKS